MTGASPFRFEVRVYHEDTDFTGMVYHARYLQFFERARTESLRQSGADHTALERDGLMLVVHSLEITFRSPARVDDLLTIETRIESVSGAQLVLDQRASCEGRAVADARVTIVLLGTEGRPRRLAGHLPPTFLAAGGGSAM